ncbi:membrane protein [Sphingomonas sp. DBB INV C78]|uniref:OpgC domain-containing protein n=1 Tax=Sphingomonas sp. DBB INV C78 TaxID=3349434 RepID=UPI0036D2E7AC
MATGESAAIRPPRDLRIDFLRGFFILHLCGTHFTWFADVAGFKSPLRFYGLPSVGLSSPAEFFVFFSGYVMALVLARHTEKIGFWLTQARTLDRAWSLYIFNVFSFAVVAACVGFLFDPQSKLYAVSGVERLVENPARFMRDFMTFQDNLAFFEILRNYIFFIPLVAIFLWLARIRVWLPLLISFVVWLAHQTGLTTHLSYPTFNPFAWQFLFFLGATIAIWKPLPEWQFPRHNVQIAICLALLAGAFAFRLIVFPQFHAELVPGANKTDVGPLRLIHAALVLWAALLLLPSSQWLGRFRLTRAVIAVGQNSLECFCLSNVLVYLGAHLMGHAPQSMPLYWVVLTGLIGAELLAARLFGWFKAEPWRAAA